MEDQNFLGEDWDYAVILDSARFDIFQDVYQDYFEGRLEKRKSPASTSAEWLDKVLEDEYDIAWFSTSFFVNSIEKPLDTLYTGYSLTPAEHISEVFDLWDSEWSEQGTVRPEKVRKYYREEKEDIESKRVVFHYMQPHMPVVGRGKSFLYNIMRKYFHDLKNGKNRKEGLLSRLLNPLLLKLDEFTVVQKVNFMGHLRFQDIPGLILNPEKTARELHEENLRIALREVRKLVEDLEGKVVITSDHGEAFGEKGVWGHKAGKEISELTEVPWLEIKDVK